MQREQNFDLFAITAPGLERVCAAELAGLGAAGEAEPGGVSWRGDARSLYRANLESRTASRIVARAGVFRARGFEELERHVARLPWRAFVAERAQVVLRVTSRKSKLYHEGAIAERVSRVLQDRFGVGTAGRWKGDDESDAVADEPGGQLVIVRFLRDTCTISVDASGALLHQRGYRQAIGRAPLRETVAAALLLAAGWDGAVALVDPMCGSGTIPIEGALLARRIAPGIANAQFTPRAYAFQEWPGFDADEWRAVVTAAQRAVLQRAGVPIVGTDAHGGAVNAAIANAARAGVAADVAFERRALTALEPPASDGHLVTNAPYGVRVGEQRELYALYAALGRVAAERLHGWRVSLLAADARLAAATGLPLQERLATRNGGIAVRLLSADIPE